MIKVTGHSHKRKSYDDHRKVVHRLCSSYISSIQEITRTLLSSLCQLELGELSRLSHYTMSLMQICGEINSNSKKKVRLNKNFASIPL